MIWNRSTKRNPAGRQKALIEAGPHRGKRISREPVKESPLIEVRGQEFSFYTGQGNEKMGKDIARASTLPTDRTFELTMDDGSKMTVKGTCQPDLPCHSKENSPCYAFRRNQRFGLNSNSNSELIHEFENTALLRSGHYNEFIDHTLQVCDCGHYKAFRFNEAGDFMDEAHLQATIYIAMQRPRMPFLAFTKNYGLIRNLEEVGAAWTYFRPLSDFMQDNCPNYRIIISWWPDMSEGLQDDYLRICNSFPVARYTQNLDRFKDKAWGGEWDKVCGENCTRCMKCWDLNPGEYIWLPDRHWLTQEKKKVAKQLRQDIDGSSVHDPGWYEAVGDIASDYLVGDETYDEALAEARTVYPKIFGKGNRTRGRTSKDSIPVLNRKGITRFVRRRS